MIPIIYELAEAARILGFSESYLRSRLRDRTFAGMKRAGRWAMTEAQIEAAIQSICVELRLPDPPSPSGVSKHSRHGRRLREWGSSVVELLRANGISRAVGEEETGFSEVDDLQG